jgi:hypothetical protein
MKQDHDADALAARTSQSRESCRPAGGTLLGWYPTAAGYRDVRAVTTLADGLCVVDEAPKGAFLVERELEGLPQARALAADYVAIAWERGGPQTRRPWPPDDQSPERGES